MVDKKDVELRTDYSASTLRVQSHSSWAWLAPTLIFGGSALLYSINLDRLPHPDELYHVLAARGIVEYGEPRIAEGLYDRVIVFTWLVARLFAWLGESLAVARLPSLFATALLNVLLFLWLRKEAGSLAAWLGTALFAASPFTVDYAQFARFYALQSLTFFVGCVAVYEMLRKPVVIDRRLFGYGMIAISCLAFAIYTQPTTFLGLTGLGLWVATVVGIPWLTDTAVRQSQKLLVIAVGIGGLVLLLGVFLASGIAADLWHRYRWVPPWNAPHANEFWYYHVFYVLFYPSLWPVVGLLGFAALASRPRVAWFAMVIFVMGFLLNSFGGPKSPRYLSYAQPFLFILFGLGSAAVWPWLVRAGSAFKQQLENHLAGIGLAGRRLPEVVLWGSLLVVILGNAAFVRTVTLLADVTVPPQMPPVRWPEALPFVEPLLNEVDVVVTMAELETLYFWERYDILFSPSRLTEMADQTEFSADHRTGRPVITTGESLSRVVDCTASGLFISNTHRWGRANLIDQVTAEFIETTMTRLDLPAALQLVVFAWDHSPVTTAEDCAMIAETVRGPDE